MASALGQFTLPAMKNLKHLVAPQDTKCYPGTGFDVTDLVSKDVYTFSNSGPATADFNLVTQDVSEGYFNIGKTADSWVDSIPSIQSGYPNRAGFGLEASDLTIPGGDACCMIWFNIPQIIGGQGRLDFGASLFNFLEGDGMQDNNVWDPNNLSAQSLHRDTVLNESTPILHFDWLDGYQQKDEVAAKDDWICFFYNKQLIDIGNLPADITSTDETSYQQNTSNVDSFRMVNYRFAVTGRFSSEEFIQYKRPNTTTEFADEGSVTGTGATDITFNDIGGSTNKAFVGKLGVIAVWDRTLTNEEMQQAYSAYKRFYRHPKPYKCALVDSKGLPIYGSDGNPLYTSQINSSATQISQEL